MEMERLGIEAERTGQKPTSTEQKISTAEQKTTRPEQKTTTAEQMTTRPEPRHVTAEQPESCHVLSVTPRYSRSVLQYPNLVCSVRDAPLVSARAAGIPKPAHFSPPVPALIPLSEALPMMGIALCCVWAAYTTSELPQVMAPAAASPEVAAHAAEPPEAAVLASAPCIVVAPSNVLSACHVTVKGTVDEHCTCPVTELYLFPDVTTVEPPEVAASAAEPPEVSVVTSYESLSCPVTAMEPVCESLSCPVTAMEAVCECSSCPVTAMEAVCESLSCPVVAMEAICELLPCFELTTEAINEPSFAHVTAYELLSCPESAEEAGYELPVPSVTTEEVMGELPYCCIAPLGPVRELLTLPVMNSEIINAPHICPVNPITAMEALNKPSVSSVSPRLQSLLSLSRIRSVAFRPIATRGRLSIILTLTPHSTLDCISHHPLH